MNCRLAMQLNITGFEIPRKSTSSLFHLNWCTLTTINLPDCHCMLLKLWWQKLWYLPELWNLDLKDAMDAHANLMICVYDWEAWVTISQQSCHCKTASSATAQNSKDVCCTWSLWSTRLYLRLVHPRCVNAHNYLGLTLAKWWNAEVSSSIHSSASPCLIMQCTLQMFWLQKLQL